MAERNGYESIFELMEGESILQELHPHFLGMYRLYLVWLYLGGVGILLMAKRKELVETLASRLPSFTHNTIYLAVWLAAVLIPAAALTFLHVRGRWLAVMVGSAAAAIYLKEFTALGRRGSGWYVDNIENLVLIAMAICGILLTEWFRKRQTYLVTTHRLVVLSRGLFSSVRSLPYSAITDLIQHKTLVGRIFDFGTIIPVTASGIGAGMRSAAVTVGAGGQAGPVAAGGAMTLGRGTNTAVESFDYTLYNIPDPEKTYNLIFSRITGGGAASGRTDEGREEEG